MTNMDIAKTHWPRRNRYTTKHPWVSRCGASSKRFANSLEAVTCPACRIITERLKADIEKVVNDGTSQASA